MEGHGLCALLVVGPLALAGTFLDLWWREREQRKRYEEAMRVAGKNLEEADQAGFLSRAQHTAKRVRIYLEEELADG